VFTLQINEVLAFLPKNNWQITLRPESVVGTMNSTCSGMGRVCFVWPVAAAAALSSRKHAWLTSDTQTGTRVLPPKPWCHLRHSRMRWVPGSLGLSCSQSCGCPQPELRVPAESGSEWCQAAVGSADLI